MTDGWRSMRVSDWSVFPTEFGIGFGQFLLDHGILSAFVLEEHPAHVDFLLVVDVPDYDEGAEQFDSHSPPVKERIVAISGRQRHDAEKGGGNY